MFAKVQEPSEKHKKHIYSVLTHGVELIINEHGQRRDKLAENKLTERDQSIFIRRLLKIYFVTI